ncbi:hypothetical protein D3C74_279740 [compost metagenome]
MDGIASHVVERIEEVSRIDRTRTRATSLGLASQTDGANRWGGYSLRTAYRGR